MPSTRASLVLFAAIALRGLGLNAQTTPHPSFAGVWVMDTTKFQKNDSALVALKLTVSQAGDTLLIVTDGTDARGGSTRDFSSAAKYLLSGERLQVGASGVSSTTTLSWDGPTLVLVMVREANGRSARVTERWNAEPANGTLSKAQTVLSGGREISQTLVFTKSLPR